MEVEEKNNTLIISKEHKRPIIIVSVLFLLALGIFAFFDAQYITECERQKKGTGQCRFERRYSWSHTEDQWELKDVTGVELTYDDTDEYINDESEDSTIVNLITSDGKIKLYGIGLSSTNKKDLREYKKLKRFFEGEGIARVRVVYSTRLAALLFSSPFCLFVFWGFFFSGGTSVYIFDKNRRKLVHQNPGLFGSHLLGRRKEFLFKTIQQLVFIRSEQSESDKGYIMIQTQNGHKLTFDISQFHLSINGPALKTLIETYLEIDFPEYPTQASL